MRFAFALSAALLATTSASAADCKDGKCPAKSRVVNVATAPVRVAQKSVSAVRERPRLFSRLRCRGCK